MRRRIAVAACSAVLGLMTLSSHAMAQQKTLKACQAEWRANKAANQANGITEKAFVTECRGDGAPTQPTAATKTVAGQKTAVAGQKTAKDCREEWRANKAANQTSGITEKAYVDQCRTGNAPSQTTAAPAAPPAAPPAASETRVPDTPTSTAQKTAKACRDEWRANKAANQANGVTERAYVEQCRGGGAPTQTTAAPTTPPAPAPTPTAAAPPVAEPSPPPTSTARPAPRSSASRGASSNEFSTEAQAKAQCPSDTVVWVSLPSKQGLSFQRNPILRKYQERCVHVRN
jgi:hypothetical protein